MFGDGWSPVSRYLAAHPWFQRSGLWQVCLAICASLAIPATSNAQCNTSPNAVDDVALHIGEILIVDVLANDLEPDGEALTITSTSTTCQGSLSESFGLVSLLPSIPASEVCSISYTIVDERGATDSATVEVRSNGLLFRDGFETGDSGEWSQGQ